MLVQETTFQLKVNRVEGHWTLQQCAVYGDGRVMRLVPNASIALSDVLSGSAFAQVKIALVSCVSSGLVTRFNEPDGVREQPTLRNLTLFDADTPSVKFSVIGSDKDAVLADEISSHLSSSDAADYSYETLRTVLMPFENIVTLIRHTPGIDLTYTRSSLQDLANRAERLHRQTLIDMRKQTGLGIHTFHFSRAAAHVPWQLDAMTTETTALKARLTFSRGRVRLDDALPDIGHYVQKAWADMPEGPKGFALSKLDGPVDGLRDVQFQMHKLPGRPDSVFFTSFGLNALPGALAESLAAIPGQGSVQDNSHDRLLTVLEIANHILNALCDTAHNIYDTLRFLETEIRTLAFLTARLLGLSHENANDKLGSLVAPGLA